ncbi:ferredoxin [Streptomyces phaeolivaceus]|uniref:Ferredoxin n=1 Tax=Streptomyces phaeolivaceus TaxID=2653200 RepID=A0A5P8KID8_9ACTN|nr:ferredoxin [Streptomyces phaeolivaceus]QFR02791.1 ferredoxin [Streptomyces phaeolivaceus]
MKLHIDETKCRGAGQCVLIAPEVFDQRDEDGIAVLLAPTPPPSHHPTVHEAAAVCPAGAIGVDDEEG